MKQSEPIRTSAVNIESANLHAIIGKPNMPEWRTLKFDESKTWNGECLIEAVSMQSNT